MKITKVMLLSILAILLSVSALAQNSTVKLASISYPPYYGPEMTNSGFVTEIIRAAYESRNYTVEVDFMLWSEALNKTRSGEYDGIYTLWYRKDREQWYTYSDALPPNEAVICKLRNNPPSAFQDISDLEGYSIGTVSEYTYSDEFVKAGLNTIEAGTDKEILGMLFSGHVDLIIIDRAQAKFLAEKYYPQDKQYLYCFEKPVKTEYQHIGFSLNAKDYQQKMLAFNSGLKSIIADGTYDKILVAHGYDEYVKNIVLTEDGASSFFISRLDIASQRYHHVILSIILIAINIFFLLQTVKEKYLHLMRYFKSMIILSILFVMALLAELLSPGITGRLYSSRIVHVISIFYVASLSMIPVIVATKKPLPKRLFNFLVVLLIALSSVIFFTGYVEKTIIIDTVNPLISISVQSEYYLVFPIVLITMIALSLGVLIYNYLKKHTKLLLNFFTVYLVLITIILFDIIFFSLLNFDYSALLMITPVIVNFAMYFVLLKNNLFTHQKKERVFLTIGVAFLLIVAIFLVNTYQTTSEIRENELLHVKAKLDSVAVTKANHLNTYLDQTLEQFKLVTSRNRLKSLIRSYNFDQDSSHLAEISENIKAAEDPIEEFERICVIDLDGKVIASTDPDYLGKNVSEKQFFISGLETEKVFFVSEQGMPKLFVSGPFVLDGEVIGVGVTVVKTDILNSIMAETSGFELTEEVFLIDKSNIIVTPSKFLDNSVLQLKVNTFNSDQCWLHESPSASLNRHHDQIQIGQDYRNVTVIGTHEYITEMDWCLLAEMDYAEAVSDIAASIRKIWLFTFGVIVTLSAVAIVFSYVLTSALRTEVRHKTEEIQKINKNLEKTVEQRTKELEELTNDLEEKVEQRTKDLNEKVKELEKFQNLTVGREMRMIELKKELKELKKRKKQ